ncbi:MAG: photosystem II stability/assembly factor-like uncharacterized protein [Cryomorphaceae bacterium]|jgi:photosystem II stability/assembly factor-like uncharacterized protein
MNPIKTLFIAALTIFTLSTSAQWTVVEWLQTDGLDNIDFVDDVTGYAQMQMLQGFTSSFEKTEDGGQTWTELNIPVSPYDIQDMDFHLSGGGVLVTRSSTSEGIFTKVYRTMDDGANWEEISPDETATGFGMAQIQMLDANTVFFVTDNYFYRTTNGGDDWTAILLPAAGISVNFFDGNHGVIGTWDATFNYFGGMLATSDGGTTWNETVLDLNYSVIGVVGQLNETTSFAAPVKWGGNGQVQFYKTIDNGLNWTTVSVPETDDNATLTGFDFRDEEYGVITLSSNTQFYIYKTIDGGDVWELQNQMDQLYISDMDLTPNSGYIAAQGGFIFRLDAPLGVEERDGIDLKIYPNPAASGQLIQWNARVDFTQIRIMEITGKTVFQEKLTVQNSMLPNLSRGVYLVSLQNEGIVKTMKIMVE